MHIVTGGAGFIGSNLVRALADRGHNDIVVVDDLEDGHKFVNFSDLPICSSLMMSFSTYVLLKLWNLKRDLMSFFETISPIR